MIKHTPKQTTVFLQWINNLLRNDFLKMELRERKKTCGLKFRHYLQELPTPSLLKQQAYELLWAYWKFQDLKSRNIEHAIDDVQILLKNYGNEQALKEKLNKTLDRLELPNF